MWFVYIILLVLIVYMSYYFHGRYSGKSWEIETNLGKRVPRISQKYQDKITLILQDNIVVAGYYWQETSVTEFLSVNENMKKFYCEILDFSSEATQILIEGKKVRKIILHSKTPKIAVYSIEFIGQKSGSYEFLEDRRLKTSVSQILNIGLHRKSGTKK